MREVYGRVEPKLQRTASDKSTDSIHRSPIALTITLFVATWRVGVREKLTKVKKDR